MVYKVAVRYQSRGVFSINHDTISVNSVCGTRISNAVLPGPRTERTMFFCSASWCGERIRGAATLDTTVGLANDTAAVFGKRQGGGEEY